MSSYKNQNVLFVTTKNLDYLRNTQEIRLIRETAKSLVVIGSREKSYAKRLAYVYRKLFTMSLRSFDVVFLGFAPQLVLPWFAHRFRKKTVGIDFFISVYDTMVCDRKKWKAGSLAAKFCHWLDTRTLQLADYVISDTNAHGDYFSAEFGKARGDITTLYLEADTSIYTPKPQEKPLEWKDKFLVLYFGSILPVQGVDVIFRAMELMREENAVQFLFIGPVEQKLMPPEQENIAYIHWLPQPELATAISQADLCLAGHFNRENGKANRTIPGKAYLYEAMHKPMILGENSANRERYTEKMKGISFVEMGNPEALRDAILSELEQWKRTKKS